MKILYVYQKSRETDLDDIYNDIIPTDRVYGFIELKNLGYDIDWVGSEMNGMIGRFFSNINKKFGFSIKGTTLLSKIREYDVVLVNGPFSTITTITCFIFNKKLIYIDSLFRVPKSFLRKKIIKININMASFTVALSDYQLVSALDDYNVKKEKLIKVYFTIDMKFYNPTTSSHKRNRPFVLSVGRDQGRDYMTLVKAMEGVDADLKIVTLPYLLKGITYSNTAVQIYENISYECLLQLYSDAYLVVIPIKKWATSYASGVRGLLEAKALNKPVIVSRSRPLSEYVTDGDGVEYVDAEDVKDLREAINFHVKNSNNILSFGRKGSDRVRKKFDMNVFARILGRHIESLVRN